MLDLQVNFQKLSKNGQSGGGGSDDSSAENSLKKKKRPAPGPPTGRNQHLLRKKGSAPPPPPAAVFTVPESFSPDQKPLSDIYEVVSTCALFICQAQWRMHTPLLNLLT